MPEVGAVPPSYHLNSSNPKRSLFPPPRKKTPDSAFDSRIYFCMSSTAARLTVSRLQSRIASSTSSSTSTLLFRRTSSFTLLPDQTRFKSTMSSDQQIIFSKDAAAPVGPYSQAIKTPFAIFCSGQIPLGADGVLVDGSITDQTRKCCENAAAVLKEAGSSIPRVVKTMIFISDMAHFAEMNTEYEKWFSHKPARSCVAVKTLPKNVDVEIEVVALP